MDWRTERGQPWKRPLEGFWLRVRVPRVKNRWVVAHAIASRMVFQERKVEGRGRRWSGVDDGVGLVMVDLVGTKKPVILVVFSMRVKSLSV